MLKKKRGMLKGEIKLNVITQLEREGENEPQVSRVGKMWYKVFFQNGFHTK